MHLHQERFEVRSFEVDAWNRLAVPALAGWLQEAAGDHAGALGFGIDRLMARGLTWVLVGERIAVLEPIQLGDAIEIATWPSGLDRMAACREFLVRRNGALVAQATTRWLVLDLATRRPVRPETVLAAELLEPAERVLAVSGDRLPAAGPGADEKRFPIRYADIDMNDHVNNVRYLEWALEAVPEPIWRGCSLHSLEVQFLAEGRYGGAVASRAQPVAEREFLHSVASAEDGRELARLRTSWVGRGA